MRSLLAKLKNRLSPRKPPKRVVKCDDTGFALLEYEAVKVRVEWASVREIFAYKTDRFSCDEICVGFRVDETDSYYWVGEDDLGYRELLVEIEKRFTGIKTDWFSKVAYPAFALNRTTLWGEPWSSPSAKS